MRILALLQSVKSWAREGLLVVVKGHERSQQKPDCPEGSVGPCLPGAAAEVDTSYQCWLLAPVKHVKPVVAALIEASEVCWETGAGAFESLVMPREFDEAEASGSVLVRASWRAEPHSEQRHWTGLLRTLEGHWGEAQHCWHQQSPKAQREESAVWGCWWGVKA